MPIYKYTPYTTTGPNGVNLRFRSGDSGSTELAEVNGEVYVHVPDAAVIPEQPAEIGWAPANPTPEILSQIKAASRPVQLISEEMIRRIRERYSLDDEMFFARIGVGAATGMYQPTPAELAEMTEFGSFVESVRAWGREERARIGL